MVTTVYERENCEGERTEIALNDITDDGLTNGASNVIQLVQLHQPKKPSRVIWVQFDDDGVGKKTRQENMNRNLCSRYSEHVDSN